MPEFFDLRGLAKKAVFTVVTIATAAITTLTVSGVGSFADGSSSSPSITFTNDSNTGFFRSATDTISVAAGGNNIFSVASTGINVSGDVTSTRVYVGTGSAGSPSIKVGSSNSGLYLNSSLVAISQGGVFTAQFGASGSYLNSHWLTQSGATYDIGSATWSWRDAYFSRNGYFGGTVSTTNLVVATSSSATATYYLCADASGNVYKKTTTCN